MKCYTSSIQSGAIKKLRKNSKNLSDRGFRCLEDSKNHQVINKKSQPNIIFSLKDLSELLDGEVLFYHWHGKQFENGVFGMLIVKTENYDRVHDDPDLYEIYGRACTCIWLQLPEKEIHRLMDKGKISIVHLDVTPVNDDTPGEYWLMSDVTKKMSDSDQFEKIELFEDLNVVKMRKGSKPDYEGERIESEF